MWRRRKADSNVHVDLRVCRPRKNEGEQRSDRELDEHE